jgi:ABC-type multidrug transport system ATPase subunit
VTENFILRIEQLTKQYGGKLVLAVDAVELDRGDKVAIYGNNGSGKSTLLRILAGLVGASGGRELRTACWKRASIGFLPQSGGVYRDLSVRENLQAVHYMLGTAANADRLEWLINRFGLSGFLDKRVEQLSGGYRRLVALFCLLSSGADFLFLDEPFASIDPDKRAAIQETLQRFADEFPLLVVSEHINNIQVTETTSFWNKRIKLEALNNGRNDQAGAAGVL